MPNQTPLIALLAGGLVAAFLLGTLAHRFKLSPLVGYLLAGIIVGPFTPGFVADANMASAAGRDRRRAADVRRRPAFFPRRLARRCASIAFPFALAPIAFATLLGWGLAPLFIGWTNWQGVVYGLALSVASTVVLLQRARGKPPASTTERGKAAIGWLIVEDLIVILVLVLLPVLADARWARARASWTSARWCGRCCSPSASWPLFVAVDRGGRPARWCPGCLRRVAGTGSRELFTLGVLAIALGIAFGSSALFGVSIALGASSPACCSTSPNSATRRPRIRCRCATHSRCCSSSRSACCSTRTILVEQPLPVLATFLIITVGKPLAAFALVKLAGRSNATAFTIGASIAQIGEFSFILAGLAVGLSPAAARRATWCWPPPCCRSSPTRWSSALLVRWLTRKRPRSKPPAKQANRRRTPDRRCPRPAYPRWSAMAASAGNWRRCSRTGVPLSVIDSDPDLVALARSRRHRRGSAAMPLPRAAWPNCSPTGHPCTDRDPARLRSRRDHRPAAQGQSRR